MVSIIYSVFNCRLDFLGITIEIKKDMHNFLYCFHIILMWSIKERSSIRSIINYLILKILITMLYKSMEHTILKNFFGIFLIKKCNVVLTLKLQSKLFTMEIVLNNRYVF